MNCTEALHLGRASFLILAVAGSFNAGLLVGVQNVQHLAITQPGGMPGLPVMTGIQRVTNGVSVTWYGPSGYYQLLQKLGLENGIWQPVGGFNLTNRAIVPVMPGNAFFRVLGASPHYAGAQTCIECHSGIHGTVKNTAHAGAFTNELFVAQGGQTNSSLLPAHTVGYGLPTGFVSKYDPSSNPRLAGVQCENCHGPAGVHAANPDDPTTVPRVESAAQVCGGCHTGAPHPTFDEWKTSGHATVTEDMSSTSRINSCGRCHSGSARLALLNGKDPSMTVTNDANVPITCAVCHDPHSTYAWTNVLAGVHSFTNTLTGISIVITNNELGARYTNQVRHALSSLQDYHATGDFATNYNATINVCAQCHNDRCASSTKSDRPPHHSLQYNMLLGTVGELATGLAPNLPATHSLIEKQCVGCHMQKSAHKDGPPEVAAVTGHKFAVTSYEACAVCHGSAANAEAFVGLVKGIITTLSQRVKGGLNQWATNNAPAEIRKYGALAWEYQNAGQLSSPDGTLSGPISNDSDPIKDEQKYIPANIKKARFNLYLVVNDGSHGAHNGPYAITLLDAAQNWIDAELNK